MSEEQLEERLEELERKLNTFKRELSGIRNSIQSVNACAYHNLQDFDKRISKLEDYASMVRFNDELSAAQLDEFKLWVKAKNKEESDGR